MAKGFLDENRFRHKDAVPTHHGYFIFPKLTLKIFALLVDRLSREDRLHPSEVLRANLTVLNNLRGRYEAANIERLKAPVIYTYFDEVMRDIERQLFGDLIGHLVFRAVCIRDAPEDLQVDLKIYHGPSVGSLKLEMDSAVWTYHYLVQVNVIQIMLACFSGNCNHSVMYVIICSVVLIMLLNRVTIYEACTLVSYCKA